MRVLAQNPTLHPYLMKKLIKKKKHCKKKNLAVKQQKHTKVSYKKQSQEREQGDHFTKH